METLHSNTKSVIRRQCNAKKTARVFETKIDCYLVVKAAAKAMSPSISRVPSYKMIGRPARRVSSPPCKLRLTSGSPASALPFNCSLGSTVAQSKSCTRYPVSRYGSKCYSGTASRSGLPCTHTSQGEVNFCQALGIVMFAMSTIEIRNYEGDGADLADLIGRTWKTAFTGKMRFPLWDRAFLNRRLLDERGGGREFLVSAYRGTKIVGCLLAEPMDLRIRGQAVRGTLSSWLSVDPEVRVPNIAIRMVEGLRKRHQEHGVAISIGCTSSDPNAPTRRFWNSLARRKPDDFRFFGPIRFWSRVLDSSAVATSGLNAFERIGPRFARLIPSLASVSSAFGRRSTLPADRSDALPRLRSRTSADR